MEKEEVQVVIEDVKRPYVTQNVKELTVTQAEELKLLTASNGILNKEKESLLKELKNLKLEVADQKSRNLLARHEQENQVLDLLNTELTCAICSEIIIEAVSIDCGHFFCSHCILTWFSQQPISRSCPNCRTVTSKDPVKISRLNCTIDSLYAIFSQEVQSDRRQLLEDRKAEQMKAQVASAARPGRSQRQSEATSVQTEVRADPVAILPSTSQLDHNPQEPAMSQADFYPDSLISLSVLVNPRFPVASNGSSIRPTTMRLSSRSDQVQGYRHIRHLRAHSRIHQSIQSQRVPIQVPDHLPIRVPFLF